MIANLGYWLLIVTSIINLLGITTKISKLFGGDLSVKINRLLPIVKFPILLISFLCLIYSFAISDFSVSLVYKYSSSIKPLIYKIVGSWANHEGSMFLWLLEFSLVSLLFTVYSKVENKQKSQIIFIQAIIELMFLIFIINYSNPFERIEAPLEGSGLNPALQDIGLAIHPPILYMGYVLLFVPYAYSITVLTTGCYNLNSSKLIKSWIITSWICLSVGIMLGSWWAYRELGWGGFWFWDPVENLALMPWLITTALFHTIITVNRKNIFTSWFLFLSITAFCLSLLGSFLVRSGILISVHSFASDPTRGIYLASILLVISLISFGMFVVKKNKFIHTYSLAFGSYEFGIFVNNILLITAAATILIGIIYPIIYQFTGHSLSVGEGYFVTNFMPIILVIILSMALLSSKNTLLFKFFEVFSSILLALLIAKLTNCFELFYILFLLASLFLIIAMLNLFIKTYKLKLNHSYKMILSHLIFGTISLALTINSYNNFEDSLYLKVDDNVRFGNYNIHLKEIDYAKSNNFYIRKAKFLISKNNKEVTYLYPEFRFYSIEDQISYEPAIYHSLFADLYIVIGEMPNGKLATRIYYKPFMTYLWIGVILMVLPSIICLKNKN